MRMPELDAYNDICRSPDYKDVIRFMEILPLVSGSPVGIGIDREIRTAPADQKFCAIPELPCCGNTDGFSIRVFRRAGTSRITGCPPPYEPSP